MDRRLRHLAEQLDAGLIARREFLRRAAILTGGAVAGPSVLRRMAGAQTRPPFFAWLFRSFVPGVNDVLAKQIEAWAKERKLTPAIDWATFGERDQRLRAGVETGLPHVTEMNAFGPIRYKALLQDVSKLATELAAARGGLLPGAAGTTKVDGTVLAVPRYTMINAFYIRKDVMEDKGLTPPKLYDPDVIAFARKTQNPVKDLWGFGQTLNRCDDGEGFMQSLLWDYGGGVWDNDGKPALATSNREANLKALQFAVDSILKHKIQPPGVMDWTDVSNNEAYLAGKLVTTNNGPSLYYALVQRLLASRTLLVPTPGGPAGSFLASNLYSWGVFARGPGFQLAEDMIRWVEDEKRFAEYVRASIGVAGPVYTARARDPYWKEDANAEAILQNSLRGVHPGYPGPMTPAAVDVQSQNVLTDMAARAVIGGLSPETALKEAHQRVEEIYRAWRTAEPEPPPRLTGPRAR
ncbi:MAG TPA: extracellular solute-binding protein [Methylomirabilota bacterium]|nr:extracellular solute-binding protein [Methylomirabilota bacterium]